MGTKLVIESTLNDNILDLKFIGQIDEDADFTKVDLTLSSSIIFDFAQVTLLNSCGIREWITFIDKIPATTQVIYRNCQQIIIEQMNMVHGFIKKGAMVESFYAPYYCAQCDKEHKILIHTSQVIQGKAPTSPCPKCQGELEFDAIESQYFNFLK